MDWIDLIEDDPTRLNGSAEQEVFNPVFKDQNNYVSAVERSVEPPYIMPPKEQEKKEFIDKNIGQFYGQIHSNKNDIKHITPLPAKPVLNHEQDIRQTQRENAINEAQSDQKRQEYLLKGYYDNVPQIDPNMGNQEIRNNTQKVVQMLGLTTPKFDEAKAERLKKVAAINAGGQALSAAISGLMARKNGVVLNTSTDITPKALAEYSAMIEKDKDNQYKTAVMQAQAGIQGLQQEAANTLSNKKWNQEQKTKAYQAIQKFSLDKYLNDEKYRQKMNELTLKHGFDMSKLAQEQGFDEKKMKFEAKNRIETAKIRAGATITAASIRGNDKEEARNKPIEFINKQTGLLDAISPQSATAIVLHAKSAAEAGKNQYELQKEAQTPGSLYNLISRYLAGGLTVSEKEALMSAIYNSQNSLATKQFSANDMEAAYGRVSGKQETSSQPTNNNQNEDVETWIKNNIPGAKVGGFKK